MDIKNFERGLKLLDQRFRGGKTTPPQTGEIYYNRLKSIPDKPWLEICEAAMDDFKNFPTPGELRQLWYEWKNKNPDRMIKPDRTDCPECSGIGLLWARKHDEELSRLFGHYRTSTVFRCAKCENWKGQVPEYTLASTIDRLQAQGYEVEQLTGIDRIPSHPKDVHSLVQSVFRPIGDLPTDAELELRRQSQQRALDQYLGERDDSVPF